MRKSRPGRRRSAVAAGIVVRSQSAAANSFASECLEGRTLLSTFVVTHTLDFGPGSLRQAITDANASAGHDTVTFNIPGTDPSLLFGAATFLPLTALPDITDQITIDGATQTAFGGNTNANGPEVVIRGLGVAGDGLKLSASNSVISGIAVQHFSGSGIVINGSGNTVRNSYLGTSSDGTVAMGNGGLTAGSGLEIESGTGNIVENNLISGNGIGLHIKSSNNIVRGNKIGTDRTGEVAIANGGAHGYFNAGIMIENGSGNVIGGASLAQRNQISGNLGSGVLILAGTNNTVSGNFIGTTANGLGAVPNTANGVYLLNGSSNIVGSATMGGGNLISGNLRSGVQVYAPVLGTGAGHQVIGNWIGVDASGAGALGNGYNGVETINISGITIGGAGAKRNVIAGNGENGISITSSRTDANNVLENNLIGVVVDGAGKYKKIGNAEDGIYLAGGAVNNLVGGSAAGQGNVISGNGGSGIAFFGGGFIATSKNTIAGNLIGTTPAGDRFGNALHGVEIIGSDNTIGGSAAGANVIAYNGGDGVSVTDFASEGNGIRYNSIHSNGGLAINLVATGEASGVVTANDSLDADTGANSLQNRPVIAAVTVDGGTVTIWGSLSSTPSSTLTVDVYSSAVADASLHGGAQTHLGTAMVLTDANGYGIFNLSVPLGAGVSNFTASATSANGDTSELALIRSVLNLGGTSADDAYYVRKNGSAIEVFAGKTASGSPVFTTHASTLASAFTLAGQGKDTLTIDLSGGNPLPSSVFSYSADSNDTLRLVGTSGSDQITINATQVVFNDTAISYGDAETVVILGEGGNDTLNFNAPELGVAFHGGSGNNTLNVNGGTLNLVENGVSDALNINVNAGATLNIKASQDLAELSIEEDGFAFVSGGANKVIRTKTLNVDGLLDLNDNGMIVRQTPLSEVRDMLMRGRGTTPGGIVRGSWDGASGITSSAAHAAYMNNHKQEMRSLLFGRNSHLIVPMEKFMGHAISDSDVLIRYTRTADMNMDGKVTNMDITIVAGYYRGELVNETGEPNTSFQADLNFDGKVDAADVQILIGFYNPLAPAVWDVLD